MPASSPVTRGASTAVFNPVLLQPFQVLNVVLPGPWDPSAARLPVSYEISDPNRLIRNGRILYKCRFEGRLVQVHHVSLQASQWTGGRHEVPEGQGWDGTIHEGIKDLIGKRVTADLSAIEVTVEVWNNQQPEPAPALSKGDGGTGRTQRANEWRSSQKASVAVDAIVVARWDTNWVIPYGDPEEPDKGKAGLIITVKNVRENTPVHIAVKRICAIDSPGADYDYTTDSDYLDEKQTKIAQPDLQGAIVRGNRVVLENGNKPVCRFNHFEEHWIHEGNNFYCFWLAFGDGDTMPASERDYVNHENSCLHMRFTVFIHAPAADLKGTAAEAKALHRFFHSTRYYRCYVMHGGPPSLQSWFDHFIHRYIVIIDGHASCQCSHPKHPTERDPKAHHRRGTPAPTRPKEMYHQGFEPDRYVCPKKLLNTPAVRKAVQADRRHYHRDFAGCGNATEVEHALALGRCQHEHVWLYSDSKTRADRLILEQEKKGSHGVLLDEYSPRMLLAAGGCRSILSQNLGKHVLNGKQRPQYYTGWVYSVFETTGSRHIQAFFRNWILGSKSNPAPSEYDTGRIVQAFRDATAKADIEHCHPRIMNRGGVLNAMSAPPDATEGAMA